MANGLVQQAVDDTADPVETDESNLTPEETENYEAAMKMVGEILYNNDESSQAVLDLMKGEDPVAGVADAAMFLISQIEQAYQGNFPEQLILPVTDEATDMLLELGETAGIFKVDESMAVAVKSATAEELVAEYGADPAAVEEHLGDITEQDVVDMEGMFGGQNA